jgi:Zn-dependent protease
MISTRDAIYLGHLGPIPLYAHWSALLMLVLAFWWSQTGSSFDLTMFLIVLTVLMSGLILHKLGHGLAAKVLGATGVTITLWAFGGLCQSQRDQTPKRELIIVGAGPAVSFALAGIGYGVLYYLNGYHPAWLFEENGQISILTLFLIKMYEINLILGIFNMLPIFPLDGGQLVYNGAQLITRNHLLVRKICLTLSVFGALLFVLWQFHLSGNQLSNHVIFSACIMFWLVSDAYRFLR